MSEQEQESFPRTFSEEPELTYGEMFFIGVAYAAHGADRARNLARRVHARLRLINDRAFEVWWLLRRP